MTGHVPGVTPSERAIRLSGALAELGITRLTLIKPDGSRLDLPTRTTDLPGLLLREPRATLETPALHIRVTPDALHWESTDPARAERLRAALNS